MNEPGQILSLRPYVDILYRHRIGSMCVAAVGLAITVCLVVMLPDAYRSSSTVLIEPQEVAPAYVTAPAATDLLNRVKILSAEVLSRAQLEQTIRQLDLYPRRRAAHESMDDLVDYMGHHVEINFGDPDNHEERLNSFTISFEYDTASLSQSVTSRLADAFLNEDLRQRNSQALAASQFFQDQVTNARSKLDEKTKEIEAYKTRNAGSLPQDLEFNLQQLDRLEQQLAATTRDMSVVQRVSPATKLRESETRLAAMRAQFSDAYPDVKVLRNEIAALKKAQAEDDAKSTTEADSPEATTKSGLPNERQLAAQSGSLRAAIADYRRRIGETPEREQELGTLVRDDGVLAQNYEQLLHKQLEAQTSAHLEERQEGGRFRILNPAILPIKPERPNRVAIAVIGTLMSLAAAFALPFVVYFTDTSFKEPDELAREFGLPVLASIPLVSEFAVRLRQRWQALRAIAVSLVTMVVSATVIWVYATRVF
jgi:polysaccharide biosynthesis transport protein